MPYQSKSGNLTLTLSGDTIPSRRPGVLQETDSLTVRQVFQELAAGFTNLESIVHRYKAPPGEAPAGARGARPTYPPADAAPV